MLAIVATIRKQGALLRNDEETLSIDSMLCNTYCITSCHLADITYARMDITNIAMALNPFFSVVPKHAYYARFRSFQHFFLLLIRHLIQGEAVSVLLWDNHHGRISLSPHVIFIPRSCHFSFFGFATLTSLDDKNTGFWQTELSWGGSQALPGLAWPGLAHFLASLLSRPALESCAAQWMLRRKNHDIDQVPATVPLINKVIQEVNQSTLFLY